MTNDHLHPPRCRAIVLGASNVVRSLAVVVDTVRRNLGTPVDLMAAIGHGRSYGTPNSVMGRRLPGILQCDLWEEWSQRESLPTTTLITDVGNDILYGNSVDQIAGWVHVCLERVAPHSERLVMTELPLERISHLSPRKFIFFRSMLFPRAKITFEEALDKAHDLNDRLKILAQVFGASMVKPALDWYGLDPIHIAGPQQRRAWQMILANWESGNGHSQIPSTSQVKLWLARPKYREVLGVQQWRAQPSVRLRDGTRISLY